MKSKKLCEECKTEIATCWVDKKNVCERCFYHIKQKNGNAKRYSGSWLDAFIKNRK